MPLNPDVLGAAMKAAADPFNNIPTPASPEALEALKLDYFKAQAAAIIAHFIANGQVVTACGAGAGTGVIS